ncbi:MAG: transcription termination/antitermination protein NusA [Candidatus Eremiobacteraeota bacterium]|nr:transcription termination/antitermination protein NusA [Candidatus Eremiobacteraeota bacterium]
MAPRKTAKKTATPGNGSAVAAPATPNPELILALHELERDRGLSFHVLIDALEAALVSAYKRNFAREAEAHGNPVVVLDREDGSYRVFARRAVVEEVVDPLIEISPADAGPKYKIGDNYDIEVTPKEFGRIAAQTAKQVIVQRIREAERDLVFDEYNDKIDHMISGTVLRYEQRNMFIDLGKTEAILPLSEQVPHESYRIGSRVRVYVMEVRKTNKGPQIVVSRTHPNVVRRLFETEIPEVASGLVEIKDIAREPGSRSKVSVWTDEEDIDAVGACLGPRSSRINNISDELHGEKIDVIQWAAEPSAYVANALQPAKVMQVHLSERQHLAQAVVPDHQLSLAIGKEGQNVRLAARLTGWRIDIHNEEQWTKVVSQQVEEEKELEEVAAMAEAAAQESGVTLSPEMLAEDEDLIRRLQELQRAQSDGPADADASETEDAVDDAEKTGAAE